MKKFHCLSFLLPVLLLMLAVPAVAEESAAVKDMTLIDTGTVKEILKSDMILLDNSKRYRLDNLRVPTDYDQPALDALSALLLNRKVNVYRTGEADDAVDRYGIPLAQVIREDGAWAQSDMLSRGLAWVDATGAGRKMPDTLKDMEAAARGQQLGFWSNPSYAVKTPDSVGRYANSFQLVEGKVLSATKKADYAYINFGRDWKKDFTINLPRKAWKLFSTRSGMSFDPTFWNGRVVRIRGWVESGENGPVIELTDPGQIEFVKK
jgi:hypothetical protein